MSGSSQRSVKVRRLPESPLHGTQTGGETTKRTSVFERLGNRPLQTKIQSTCSYDRKDETRKTVTTKKPVDTEESDLRFKVRKNKLSASPPSVRHVSSISPKESPKNEQKRTPSKCVILQSISKSTNDETKIKSLIGLVSVPTKKSPSPGHNRSELASHLKRSKNDECEDEDELEQRRQQLKRALEELSEIERDKKDKRRDELRKEGGKNNFGSLTGTCSSSDSRNLRSSAASSANGSYCTDNSYSKSGSSCSHSSDEHKVKRRRSRSPTPSGSLRTSRRSPHHLPSKPSNPQRSRSPRTPPRSVSSSSLPRRSRPLTPPLEQVKGEVKLDRHGNVRISLREKERQRKLEREQAVQRQRSPVRYDSKDAPIDDKRYSRIESGRLPAMTRLRSHSRSPRRSRESSPERRRYDERRRYEQHELDKDRRYERDDYKLKSVADSRDYRRHERDVVSRPRTPSSLKGYRNDEDEHRNKLRSHYEDNKYYDNKDNKKSNSPSSFTRSPPHSTYRYESSKNEKNRVDCDNKERFVWDAKKSPHSYTCDLSPPQSLNSKRSRASSIGSDTSRPSLSNRSLLPRKSARKETPNKNNSLSSELPSQSSIKDDLTKISDAPKSKTNALHTSEDMSPISNNSSFGDIVENETSVNESKCEKSVVDMKEKRSTKKKSESEENFSDWSDGDEDLLLQSGNNDVDCAADDVGSSRSQEKDAVKYVDDSSRTSAVDATVDSREQDDALEAISDDELDAIIGEPEPLDACNESNSASGHKLFDSLEIDWSSLVCEQQPPAPGSARKRFTPANVFSAIGFSQELAGPELTAKIISHCKEELKDAFKPFKHPVAAIHCFINEQLEERERIFGKSTLHSTALNARRDLQIRKFLSKSHLLFAECETFCESNLVS